MLHIPALAATREGNRILSSISDMGYAVRGMYGEGSQATGAFYQISNEATLGQSEERILDQIRWVIRHIVDREREERQLLMEGSKEPSSESKEVRRPARDAIRPMLLEDRVFRSYGTLMNARLISSREALDLLSWVRLGINIGILSELSRSVVGWLLVLIRPAHLQKYEGRKLDAIARDVSRTAVIRAMLRVDNA
jgi:protein arginine kinase